LVILKSAALVNVALAAKVKLVGAVKVVAAVVVRLPLSTKVLPARFRVLPAPAVPCKVIFPPLLVICPLVRATPAVNVKSLPAVMICSLVLSMVKTLATVRLEVESVKAKLVRFRVVMDRSSLARVVIPPRVKVFGDVTVAAAKLKVPVPVRTRVVPDISKVPLVIVVAAGRVTVPPLLVIAPSEKVGAAVNVRSYPAVIIWSPALSKVTAVVTAKSEPRVRA